MSDARVRDGRRRELLVATRNAGKVSELRALLAPVFPHIVDLREAGIPPDPAEDAIEDGNTFEANAVAKARYFYARGAGRPVLADDSGLCVAALGGAPGVRSRRYAGAVGTEAEVSAANTRQLLRALHGVTEREAEFVCAVAYIDDVGEIVAHGRTRGRILHAGEGTNGFGYDPVFWSHELGESFGTAWDEAKSRVSHRARAVAALVERLRVDERAVGRDPVG